VVPVNPRNPGDEYFIFSLSDNDFITQNGFMNGGLLPYADESGYNLDNQALVWTIRDFSFLFQYQTTPDALTRSF
jgi:hypothetical protein